METPQKNKYRLIYFNFMGIVEPIRLLFALARVPYDDVRIPKKDWPSVKQKMPWEVVPVLELDDGRQLSQSFTILRYLARQFGRAGGTDLENAKCDEMVDAMYDVVKECMAPFFESDAEKKGTMGRKLKDEVMPSFLGRLEGILEKGGTGVLVGSQITYADLYVAHMLSRNGDLTSLENYPMIRGHQSVVFQQKDVAEWVASRPNTPM